MTLSTYRFLISISKKLEIYKERGIEEGRPLNSPSPLKFLGNSWVFDEGRDYED